MGGNRENLKPKRVTVIQFVNGVELYRIERDREHREYQWKHLEPLNCDLCGRQIGWVFEFDLNETLIVCQDCKQGLR